MAFLYKLVDEHEMNQAKKGILSLSHPIFEFKGSEGKFIDFAHRIYDKYKKKCLNVKPSEKDLKDIKDWIEIYKKTYGEDFNDVDIVSESMIIFCGIMQGFCGYYTTKNLEDKEILKEYLEFNNSKLKHKIGIIKIDMDIFKSHHWHTNDLNKPFVAFTGLPDNLQGYNGFIHPTVIKYTDKFDDYNELLKIYNGDELRHSSNWFNNLSKEYEWQSENRLIFLLNSLERNSARIGCNHVYKYGKKITSWEEVVYCNIVDAIDYYSKGPKYIDLKVDKSLISYISFEKIFK